MNGFLTGKSLLVTGGASGIGYATAHVAARQGARVAICDRDAESGQKAVEAITAMGGETLFLPMDVTDDLQVAAAIDTCVGAFGRLDGAFNNAGISTEPGAPLYQKAGEIAEDAWQLVLAVNLTGVWRCMRHQLRHMLTRGAGASIVNNASIAGLVGLKGHAAYAASKHGVVGLTRSAAADYARSGIRINAICPGFVQTPMTQPVFNETGDKGLEGVPLQRLGTPEEIAEAVVWLLSDRASFITGLAMAADGGYTSL
jgi:NAD(P)-dependent dehydrogenase (short-subunit alcohol dehydrogenase family)